MNYEDLESEFRYYSVSSLIEQTLQEVSESMGLTDIDTGILGRNFNSVIDAVNKVTDIAIKTKNADLLNSLADLKNQIADIKLALADRKNEIVALREENFELREENKNLKEQLTKPVEKLKLTRRDDGFWYSTAIDIDPVCSACFDSTDKIIRLTATNTMLRQAIGSRYMCPVCKQTY